MYPLDGELARIQRLVRRSFERSFLSGKSLLRSDIHSFHEAALDFLEGLFRLSRDTSDALSEFTKAQGPFKFCNGFLPDLPGAIQDRCFLASLKYLV